jgi:glutamate synthase (NADPH/NADH) large chain
VIDKYFAGTTSRIGGIGFQEIAEEVMIPHRKAFTVEPLPEIFTEGIYSYRKYGEKHAWNPETIALLQWSTRTGDRAKFREYSRQADSDTTSPLFIRGLLKI